MRRCVSQAGRVFGAQFLAGDPAVDRKFLTYPESDNTIDLIVVRENMIAIGQRVDNGLYCLPGGYAERGQSGLVELTKKRKRNDLHLALGAMEVLQEIGLPFKPCIYAGEFSEAPMLAGGRVVLFGREPKQPIIPTLVICGTAGKGEIKVNPRELISARFMELFARDAFGRLYPHPELAELPFNGDHWQMILRFLHICSREMLQGETVEAMLRRLAYIEDTVTEDEVRLLANETARPGSTFFLDALGDFLNSLPTFVQYGISGEVATKSLRDSGVVTGHGKFARTVDLVCVSGNTMRLQKTLNGKARSLPALIGTFLRTGRCEIDPAMYGHELAEAALLHWVKPESVRDAVRRVLAFKAGLVPDHIFSDVFYAALGFDRDTRMPTFTNACVVIPSQGTKVNAAAPEIIVEVPIFAGDPWALDGDDNIMSNPALRKLDFDHSDIVKAFMRHLKRFRPGSNFDRVTVQMALEAQCY